MSQPDTFIERTQETRIFKDWLQQTRSPASRILFLNSKPELEKKGGLGKTWLLRHFSEIAQEEEGGKHTVVMIDFLHIRDRSGETIAECIVDELSKKYTDWNTNSFTLALSAYKESLRDREQNGVSQRAGEDLRSDLRLALQQCLQMLTPQFAETNCRILLFFDTFEIIGQDFSSVLLQNDLAFPDTYGFPYIDFVVAGREAPDREDPNWSERWGQVQLLTVEPFNREEMLQYYERQLAPQDYEQILAHIDRIHVLTQGRPILISLIADLFIAGIFTNRFSFADLLTANLEDFEEQLVRSIGNLEKVENIAVLAMAHVHHRFHLYLFTLIFATVWPDVNINYSETWSKLLKFSFIRKAYNSDNIALHDEMRVLVNKYNWEQVTASLRHDLSQGVIRYYEQEIEDNQDQPAICQTYIVEQLYHKFFVNYEDGWQTFDRLFDEAVQKWQLGYARNLLREIRKAEIYELLSAEQKAKLDLSEILLLRKEERYQDSLARCEQFQRKVDVTWLAEHGPDFLFEMGECYRYVNRFADARAQFERIIGLASISDIPLDLQAEALSRIGNIHEQLADYDKAAHCYEESLLLLKRINRRGRYIDVLNHLCLVHCYEGNLDAASRNCLMALNMCREVKDISLAMLVDSLSTAGIVYTYQQDFSAARQYIMEAQDAAEHLKHKQRLAKIAAIRGDLELAKQNYAGAKLWFEKARRTARSVSTDIEIKSLYKLALLDVYREDWERAIHNLEEVIQKAVAIKNLYRETEAHLLMVDILYDSEKHLDAEDLYQRVRAQVQPLKSYYRLLAKTEHKKALKAYARSDYTRAFESFGRFCEYMARCTLKEFTESLNEITRYLLELSAKEIPTLFTLFKEHCSRHILGRLAEEADQKAIFLQTTLRELQDLVEFYKSNTDGSSREGPGNVS